MIILALCLFGVAIWDFCVGMWIAGIISVILGIAAVVEYCIPDENSLW